MCVQFPNRNEYPDLSCCFCFQIFMVFIKMIHVANSFNENIRKNIIIQF